MNWLTLALISVTTLSIATLLERVLLKDDNNDSIGYAIVFQLLLGLIILCFALSTTGFKTPIYSIGNVIRYGISALLWTGSTVFGFQAMMRLNAGEVTILRSSGVIISIIFSVIFLNEVIDNELIIGTILVLFSVGLLYMQDMNLSSRRGIGFALLSATCAGIAVVNDVILLKNYDVLSYVSIMSFLPGIVLIVLFPRAMKSLKGLTQSNKLLTISVFTFFYALQAVSYYLSYQNGGKISHLSPIIQSSILLTVLLSAFFLKETKYIKRKIIAGIMVTIGVILLG